MSMAFTYTFMWQFFITWFPSYLVERLHLTLAEATRYAGLPFVFGLCATWAGGFLTDLLTRRFGVRMGRRGLGFAALMLAALLLYAGIRQSEPSTAAILMALAGGLGDLSLGAALLKTFCLGRGPVSTILTDGASLRAAYCWWSVDAVSRGPS